MNWARHIGFSLCVALALAACKKDEGAGCFQTMGPVRSEARELDDFSRLEVYGRIDVRIVEGSAHSAEVKFGRNLLSGIETKVSDGVLTLRNVNDCASLRDPAVVPEVVVHVRALSSVYSENAGNIVFDTPCTSPFLKFEVYDAAGSSSILFDGDSLNVIVHTGASDVSVSGTAHYAYYYSAGYGPVDGSALYALVGSVHSEGTGDIQVRASSTVYYQIFDWGDVYVYGNPQLQKWHHEGSGEIIGVSE